MQQTVVDLTQSFILFFLMDFTGSVVESYDAEESCWFLQNNSTTDNPTQAIVRLRCPPFSYDFRTPAFCCGTLEERKCCEWSIYVVNYMGGGRTDIGLGVLVGLTFLVAIMIFCFCCGIFHYSWVARVNQSHGSPRTRPTSSRISIRHGQDSRMLLIIPSSIA